MGILLGGFYLTLRSLFSVVVYRGKKNEKRAETGECWKRTSLFLFFFPYVAWNAHPCVCNQSLFLCICCFIYMFSFSSSFFPLHWIRVRFLYNTERLHDPLSYLFLFSVMTGVFCWFHVAPIFSSLHVTTFPILHSLLTKEVVSRLLS